MRISLRQVLGAAFVSSLVSMTTVWAVQGGGGGGMIVNGGPTAAGPGGTVVTGGGAPPASAAGKGTGAISGVVTDASTGQPIAGAAVGLFFRTNGTTSINMGQHATDSRGRFVFVDLPVGSYNLSVRRFGYIDTSYGDDGTAGGTRVAIALSESEWFAKADVRAWRTGALTGTVLDEHGDPAVGLTVRAVRQLFVAGQSHLAMSASGTTDDRGRYRIAGLEPGAYMVCVPSVQATVPTGVGIGTGDTAAEVEPGLRMLVSRGPLSSASPARRMVYPTTCAPGSANDGRPSFMDLSRRDDVSAMDLRLQPVPAFRVSGQIESTARAGGVVLRLLPAWGEDLGFGTEVATTVSTGDGRFTFLNVPAGDYALVSSDTVSQFQSSTVFSPSNQPQPPGFTMRSGMSMSLPNSSDLGLTTLSAGGAGLWGRANVSVSRADVTDARLTLQQGTRITGRIVVEGAATLPSFLLLAADPVSGQPSLGMPTASVNLANTQDFTIEGLMGGAYYLRLRGGASGWAIKSIAGGDRDYTTTPIDGTSGRDLTGLIVTLTDRAASLSGSVHEAASARATSGSVLLFPADRKSWSGSGLLPAQFKSAPLATNGTFELTSLPAGDYYVMATDRTQTSTWQNAEWLERAASVATRMTLAWGDKKTVELTKVVVR